MPVGTKVTNGTVSYVAGRFYVSVVVNIDKKSKYNKDLEASYHTVTEGVGIDLGVKDLAIVSDGKVFKNINKSSKVKRLEKRLRREQRCLSRKYEFRKKKGGKTATASANIEKQKLKVQKLHQRIASVKPRSSLYESPDMQSSAASSSVAIARYGSILFLASDYISNDSLV